MWVMTFPGREERKTCSCSVCVQVRVPEDLVTGAVLTS
jgi:hypothetical protein